MDVKTTMHCLNRYNIVAMVMVYRILICLVLFSLLLLFPVKHSDTEPSNLSLFTRKPHLSIRSIFFHLLGDGHHLDGVRLLDKR